MLGKGLSPSREARGNWDQAKVERRAGGTPHPLARSQRGAESPSSPESPEVPEVPEVPQEVREGQGRAAFQEGSLPGFLGTASLHPSNLGSVFFPPVVQIWKPALPEVESGHPESRRIDVPESNRGPCSCQTPHLILTAAPGGVFQHPHPAGARNTPCACAGMRGWAPPPRPRGERALLLQAAPPDTRAWERSLALSGPEVTWEEGWGVG